MLMLGCQEPFDADRHDLLGFRIAAVSAAAEGPLDVPRVAAAIVVGGRTWSEDAVELEWGWVSAPEDVAGPGFVPESSGPRPDPDLAGPPTPEAWLGLRATWQGRVRTAAIRVASSDAAIGPLSYAALPFDVATVTDDALALEARRGTAAEPAARSVAPGGFVRITAQPPDAPGTIRWMATGGGTFFELDPATTDWAAGDLRLDDDEIEGPREPVGPGPVTVLALWLADDAPTTAFRAADHFVGPIPEGVFTGGRFVPTDAPAPDGPLLRGRLEADPDSPTGVRLVDARALDEAPATWSSRGWDCPDAVDGPFDARWLLTQRCTVGDVDGMPVEIEVDP